MVLNDNKITYIMTTHILIIDLIERPPEFPTISSFYKFFSIQLQMTIDYKQNTNDNSLSQTCGWRYGNGR
jgi:hypothetical protein